MYLQEKGLLQKASYRDFKAAAKNDPSGIQTLQDLIAPADAGAV